jgi:hypothetical protein
MRQKKTKFSENQKLCLILAFKHGNRVHSVTKRPRYLGSEAIFIIQFI